jgi:hypothetical protein
VMVFILLRTPLSIGNETTTVIASAEVSLKAFLAEAIPQLALSSSSPSPLAQAQGSTRKVTSPNFEKQDWYLLFDPQSNLALQNNAGIQLKIKYLGS